MYTPCVRKEDYIEAESRTLANRFFDGAMSQMVVNFLDQRDLSSEDQHKLFGFINTSEAVLCSYERTALHHNHKSYNCKEKTL